MRPPAMLGGLALILGLAAGCASLSPPASSQPAAPQTAPPSPAPPPASPPRPAAPAAATAQPSVPPAAPAGGVTLREEKDFGQVWLAPGFDFTTSARLFGGYRGDKAIQEEDIKQLAKGLGEFMARTKGP